jgi:hypothetical protein
LWKSLVDLGIGELQLTGMYMMEEPKINEVSADPKIIEYEFSWNKVSTLSWNG